MSDQSKVTERDYIAALRERITLPDWGAIIDKAIEDAKQGDRVAREWITQQAIGANRISLLDLAATELLGVTTDREIAAQAEVLDQRPELLGWGDPPTVIQRAIDTMKAEQQAEIDRQAQEAKARKRAEREARKAATAAGDAGQEPAKTSS
jgi:hypothetical protein